MQIFVVSLTRSESRRRVVREQFDRLTLPFQFFDAVDGVEGLPPEHEHQVDRPGILQHMGRPMAESEIGCALSHATLYRKIEQEGIEHALIFEDDILPSPELPALLEAGLLEQTPDDLILLYYFPTWGFRWTIRPYFQQTRRFRFACLPLSTGAYYVSNQGARRLLQAALPIRKTADWPLLVPFQMRTSGLHPVLAHCTEADSLIQEARQVASAGNLPESLWDLLRKGPRGTRRALNVFYYGYLLPLVAKRLGPDSSGLN